MKIADFSNVINPEKPVSTVEEFLHLLPMAEKRFGDTRDQHEYPISVVYRGQRDEHFSLISSLHRECREMAERNQMCFDDDLCYRYEKLMIHEVARNYPEEMRRLTSYIDKLTWMQHFGFPTRLLDVTQSALVALYFALDQSSKRNGSKSVEVEQVNGKVYVIGVLRVEREMDVFPSEWRLSELTEEAMRNNCRERGAIRNNRKSTGPRWIAPPYLSERQRRQCGSFYLMNNTIEETDVRGACLPAHMMDVESSGRLVQEILIDGGSKESIRAELAERFGISRHYLFPESPSDYVEEAKAKVAACVALQPLWRPPTAGVRKVQSERNPRKKKEKR